MDYLVSKVRRAVIVVPVFALLALISMYAVPQPVCAGPVNLTVYGYVYDSEAQIVVGADVVVEVRAGLFPSLSTTTDVDGYYTVDFDLADWQIGDTVRTTATYDTIQDYEEAVTDEYGTMEIDVHFAYAIPEFGSFFGVVVAMVLVGSVAVISMRRGRAR